MGAITAATRWRSPTSASVSHCISMPRQASRARSTRTATRCISVCLIALLFGRKQAMPDAPMKVLIVDDEAPARRRLRELLDDCSAAMPLLIVGEAASGREALTLLGSASADLVLTDIHMPDMDGLELARHLLKLPVP